MSPAPPPGGFPAPPPGGFPAPPPGGFPAPPSGGFLAPPPACLLHHHLQVTNCYITDKIFFKNTLASFPKKFLFFLFFLPYLTRQATTTMMTTASKGTPSPTGTPTATEISGSTKQLDN